MLVHMVRIRPAEVGDARAVAQVRAQTWLTSYAGVIPDQVLAELTTPEAVGREAHWRAEHSMDGVLVAEATSAADAAEVIGFASFGPERGEDDLLGQPMPGPADEDRAELYAVYVLPQHSSSGVGRALLDRALALAAEAGYADISVWVLERHERGRRFYEQAGFAVTGETAALSRLGGVIGIRLRRLVG